MALLATSYFRPEDDFIIQTSLIVLLVIFIALLASFVPASRGHWLAPVMAIPGLLVGLFVIIGFFWWAGLPVVIDEMIAWVLGLALIPVVVAIGSLWTWRIGKREKEGLAVPKESGQTPSGPL